MKKKSLPINLLCLMTMSVVASPPPPPGFGGPSGSPVFGDQSPFAAEPPAGPMGMSDNSLPPVETPAASVPSLQPEETTPVPAPEAATSTSEPQEEDSTLPYDYRPSTAPVSADMQQADQALEQEETVEQEGINNFDVEGSGNWLLKRVWWEKTEEVYEEIKAVFNQVLETRTQFITARNKLDRELDIFYGEMGLEQGPLNDIITHILDLMEKKRKSQGDVLTPKEEALVKKTEEKEPVLAQLKLDVKAIQVVEDKLDQALNTLFKQIDVCNEYEQRAWNNFKDIARELNDKEARKSYYQTQALLDDIKKIQAYLNGAFSTYFEQTTQLARDHAQKITANMQNLRNQGIDLQKEMMILENDRDQPRETAAEHAKKEQAKKQAQLGFFGRISQFFSDLFSKLFGWFGSSETQVKARVKKAEKAGEKKIHQAEQDIKQDVTTMGQKVRNVGHDIAQDYQSGLFGAQPSVAQKGYAQKTATETVAQDAAWGMDDEQSTF